MTAEAAAAPDGGERRERVVVGVDGSPGAHRALSWALSEAEQRGASLEVVTAWELPLAWPEGMIIDAEPLAQRAAEEASEAVDKVLDGKPRPAWLTVHCIQGPPAQVLMQRCKGSDLLVVGSRGRGGFLGLLLGSTSSVCAQHATCPVVVIPETRVVGH